MIWWQLHMRAGDTLTGAQAIRAGAWAHLDVVLCHGPLAVKALQEHLARGHHHLGELEQDSAGLDDLCAVDALHDLRFLVNPCLPGRGLILETLIAQIEVVDLDEVCLHAAHDAWDLADPPGALKEHKTAISCLFEG